MTEPVQREPGHPGRSTPTEVLGQAAQAGADRCAEMALSSKKRWSRASARCRGASRSTSRANLQSATVVAELGEQLLGQLGGDVEPIGNCSGLDEWAVVGVPPRCGALWLVV